MCDLLPCCRWPQNRRRTSDVLVERRRSEIFFLTLPSLSDAISAPQKSARRPALLRRVIRTMLCSCKLAGSVTKVHEAGESSRRDAQHSPTAPPSPVRPISAFTAPVRLHMTATRHRTTRSRGRTALPAPWPAISTQNVNRDPEAEAAEMPGSKYFRPIACPIAPRTRRLAICIYAREVLCRHHCSNIVAC